MNTDNKTGMESALDLETLELLGSAPDARESVRFDRAQLEDRVAGLIDQECALPAFVTVRDGVGKWIEREIGGEKKTLTIDAQTGVESYLLRLRPGEILEGHQHEEDELCFVIEGDVLTDDLELGAGDFHLARKGSLHGKTTTVHGALMFIQAKATLSHATANR